MNGLERRLDTYGLTMIAIGSCIGSGIFTTPAGTLAYLPNYWVALIPWVLGGIATYLGAMTFSELSARFPKSGGVYVFLSEGFGPMIGFLYGWIILLIVNTGALAALSMAFADFLGFFFPLSNGYKIGIAIGLILSLSVVNTFGVGLSQTIAKAFTGLKLFALALVVVFGLWLWLGGESQFVTGTASMDANSILKGCLYAFVGVFWSFGGWHHATYLSGEAIDPQKSIPKAMLIGTMIVMVTYISVFAAYMVLAPMEVISNSQRIAGDAVGYALAGGGKLVSIAISISIFGTIAIYTMTAPRIYHAMAVDGIFFKGLSKLHPRWKTPANAIMFQAVWACILILAWGSFTKLITFVTFMDITFMALACLAIFIFRKKDMGDKDGYRVGFYPWIPLGYLIIAGSFVVYTMMSLRSEAVIGTLILGVGVPVYYYFRSIRGVL